MAEQIKRVSELPTTTSTDGLYTLGVDAKNEGVKIPLGDLLGKINDTTSTLATAIDEEEEGRRQADSKLRESINTEIAGRKAADLTKKNNDYVVSVDIVSGYVPMSDGNSYLLLDVDWETLADVIRNGNCDIVVADTHFNYKLEHVWITEDGMPYGNKLLSDNRIIRVRTFEDTNGDLRVVYDSVETDALRKTPQVLSADEQLVARANIGAQGALSTSADLALSSGNVLSLTEMAKKRLFIDLWNECAVDFGRYNEDTGFFELNGITDLTYEDAKLIYTLSAYNDFPNYENSEFGGKHSRLRTNLPCNGRDGCNMSWRRRNISTYLCTNMEVLNVFMKMPFGRPPAYSIDRDIRWCWNVDFYYGRSLRKIMGTIGINQTNAITYGYDLPKLEEMRLKNITMDYKYFYKAPKLNFASVKYMIENRGGTNAITIWYHADVYNKILGTAADSAYEGSGGTKEEWMAIADLAASKNITLATE